MHFSQMASEWSVLLAAAVCLTVLVVAAAALAGYARLAAYYAEHSAFRAPRALLSEAYGALKTGDLLYCVAGASSGTNSVLTQTYFSHAGVLVREGDLVYVSETHGLAQLMPHPAAPAGLWHPPHATLTPLLAKLRHYPGLCYLSSLSKPLPLRAAEALKRAAERACIERYPYPTLGQSLWALLGRRSPTRHCFQHAATLLRQAGLGDLKEEEFLGSARAVCALPGRPLSGGRAYGPPVQLLYDIR